MSDDKIIRFPGGGDDRPPAPRASGGKAAAGADQALDLANLSEDQKKAIQVVLNGLPFVLVGIKPTERGADFFTAVHGEPSDLRNALPHLPDVIERAFTRKGI